MTPRLRAVVVVVGASTEVDDDSHDDENEHCAGFDEGEKDLCFAVSFHAKDDIHDYYEGQEDGHQSRQVDIGIPIGQRKNGSTNLQRQHSPPPDGNMIK